MYDMSDAEVLMKLRSGLAGETEAVRSLGIDLNDKTLSEFSQERGETKGWRQMTQAEKVIVRVEKILLDSEQAAGDFSRTAGSFTNRLRAFISKMSATVTKFGQALMPLAQSFMDFAYQVSDALVPFLTQTRAAQTALELLAGAGAALATTFLIANPLAMVLTGLVLVFDDLRTMMEGGQSVLGDFIRIIFNTQQPLRWFNDKMNDIVASVDLVLATFLDLALAIPRMIEYAKGRISREELDRGMTANMDAANARARANFSARLAEQDAVKRDRVAAVSGEGDYAAFKKTYAGTGATDDEIKGEFLRQRKQAIFTGAAMPGDRDVASGLITPFQSGYMGAQYQAQHPTSVTAQVTIGGTQATKEEIKKAVELGIKDGMDQYLREAAAATAEEVTPI